MPLPTLISTFESSKKSSGKQRRLSLKQDHYPLMLAKSNLPAASQSIKPVTNPINVPTFSPAPANALMSNTSAVSTAARPIARANNGFARPISYPHQSGIRPSNRGYKPLVFSNQARGLQPCTSSSPGAMMKTPLASISEDAGMASTATLASTRPFYAGFVGWCRNAKVKITKTATGKLPTVSKSVNVTKPSKTAESANKKTGTLSTWENFKQTGGRQDLSLREHSLAEEVAKKVYDDIRLNPNDIAIIAKNTGMKDFQVKRVKEHLFLKKHELLYGRKSTFDPDPLIAETWKRLESGSFTNHDLQLIKHELFETKFEGIFKTDYMKSHNAANNAGYTSPIENLCSDNLAEIYRGFINRYK